MIKRLEIKNFKSIKDLSLDCRKINLFIGEPNTGKSNILEALGLFSFAAYGERLEDFVRYEGLINLFFDNNTHNPIKIATERYSLEIKIIGNNESISAFLSTSTTEKTSVFSYTSDGRLKVIRIATFKPFKFYRFRKSENFTGTEAYFLLPPFGNNLLAILQSNKEIREVIGEILNYFNWKLLLEPYENKIKLIKQKEEIFVSLPYILVSDTLQRVIFYLTALLSNKDSVLMFEEPESHSFPYYTKYLAECIAGDKTNQFFISTHNPYFLISVLEKARKDEIQVIIVYTKDFETKIRVLTEAEVEESLNEGIDLFFNIERFLEK